MVAKLRVCHEILVVIDGDGTRIDEEIARTAIQHLSWNLLVPETVTVKVSEGVVTLSGTVDRQYQSDEAARVVRPLKGVRHAVNEIKVLSNAACGVTAYPLG